MQIKMEFAFLQVQINLSSTASLFIVRKSFYRITVATDNIIYSPALEVRNNFRKQFFVWVLQKDTPEYQSFETRTLINRAVHSEKWLSLGIFPAPRGHIMGRALPEALLKSRQVNMKLFRLVLAWNQKPLMPPAPWGRCWNKTWHLSPTYHKPHRAYKWLVHNNQRFLAEIMTM